MIDILTLFRKKSATQEPLYAPIPHIEVVVREPEYAATLASFKNQCVALGLRKMLEGSHFSICDVDKLSKAAGVIIERDVYDSLNCLHCVSWRDMPVETRKAVYAILATVLGGI